ncbi:MAG: discoidin domain-containing protein [Verrucomicrobiae bacterium]|nr:discoidin domain-containing protein [Verrucomicrobiae bacterium]
MSKSTFPETEGIESLKPADSGTRSASDVRNALSALFQGDVGAMRCRAQETPDMTVKVNPAVLNSFSRQVYGGSQTPYSYAGGNSPSMTAPSVNSRIDIVYLNQDQEVAVIIGEESGSPSPDYASLPKTAIPLCLVYHKTTATKIVNYEDKDEETTESYISADLRPLLNLGGGATQSDMRTAQDNIALLAFRLAVQGSLTIQKMQDGIVDEYEDETGVDTGESTASYDASGDYYSNNQGDQTGSGTALSGGDASATAQEQTAENDQYEFFSNVSSTLNGLGQIFTASSAYSMTGFKVKISENGTSDVVCKGRLYATSGGLPTGSALAETANINVVDFADYVTFGLYQFTFATPYTLTNGAVYAVVVELISGSPSGANSCLAKFSTSSGYTGNSIGKSSGGWGALASGHDLVFYTLTTYGKANAFDGSTDTYWGSSQTSGSISGAGYIGYDFGAGVTKAITGFTIKQHHADQAIDSVKVQRSDNGSDWTDVETVAITADTSAQTKSFSNSTAARYWRLLANAETTSGSWEVEELGFTLSEDLELVSESFEAEATPTEARVCIFLEEVDAITLNTDFKAYVSRDDGTNWTQITLVNEGEYDTDKDILSGSVNISAQPSDKTMRYKLITDNLKVVKVHGCSLSWKS